MIYNYIVTDTIASYKDLRSTMIETTANKFVHFKIKLFQNGPVRTQVRIGPPASCIRRARAPVIVNALQYSFA
jgi:hypothetical protein